MGNPPTVTDSWPEWLSARLARLVSGLLSPLPYTVVHRLTRGIGHLVYWLTPDRRRTALANLDIMFGATLTGPAKRRLARESFANFIATTLSILWSPRDPAAFCRLAHTSPAELQQLRELLTQGRGVILCSPHLGNWELLLRILPALGLPLSIMARPLSNAPLNRVIGDLRTRTGLKLLPNLGSLLRLFKAVRRGEIVAFIMDQHVAAHDGGVWVEFGGLPVRGTPALAHLALRTGARILFFYGLPDRAGRLHIRFGPEIPVTPGPATEESIRQITQRCFRVCEDLVRAHPEHWLWCQKRWRHRPDEDATGYPYYSRAPRPKP